MTDLLKERESFCKERLSDLRSEIDDHVDNLEDAEELCIYVTGSFGRLEASRHSDLDLFFIHKGRNEENRLAYVTKAQIDADLIRLCKKMGFPEFTGGGEYLNVHYVDDILETLGSPRDDYENHFTARLLLLLESQPLHDDELYDDILTYIIDAYFRDFTGHEDDFQALFLVNDIIRFWRTLCLNYESPRNPSSDNGNQRPSAKDHRKNLKLRYSRLLTCFSAILPLAEKRLNVSPADVLQIVKTSPLDRIRNLELSGDAMDVRDRVLENYAWFLRMTDAPKADQLEWIDQPENRSGAFDKAQDFGDGMYDVLRSVVGEDTRVMRYLVI